MVVAVESWYNTRDIRASSNIAQTCKKKRKQKFQDDIAGGGGAAGCCRFRCQVLPRHSLTDWRQGVGLHNNKEAHRSWSSPFKLRTMPWCILFQNKHVQSQWWFAIVFAQARRSCPSRIDPSCRRASGISSPQSLSSFPPAHKVKRKNVKIDAKMHCKGDHG